jgi:hypothetical protein
VNGFKCACRIGFISHRILIDVNLRGATGDGNLGSAPAPGVAEDALVLGSANAKAAMFIHGTSAEFNARAR